MLLALLLVAQVPLAQVLERLALPCQLDLQQVLQETLVLVQAFWPLVSLFLPVRRRRMPT